MHSRDRAVRKVRRVVFLKKRTIEEGNRIKRGRGTRENTEGAADKIVPAFPTFVNSIFKDLSEWHSSMIGGKEKMHQEEGEGVGRTERIGPRQRDTDV